NKKFLIVTIIIFLLIGSFAFYVTSLRSTQHTLTDATLVPALVISQATPDSDPVPNNIARLVSDDLSQSGLGITTKLFTADSGTVIYAKLYYGDMPGGYNAYDIGYNNLLGTSD